MHDTDIRAQLEEERRIIDAYPYLHLEVESIPETGERGVMAYEAHDEDDELLSLSHVFADDMNAAEATRLAHSWNALPVRNAQIEAVLQLCRDMHAAYERDPHGDAIAYELERAIEEAGK